MLDRAESSGSQPWLRVRTIRKIFKSPVLGHIPNQLSQNFWEWAPGIRGCQSPGGWFHCAAKVESTAKEGPCHQAEIALSAPVHGIQQFPRVQLVSFGNHS